MNQKYKTSAHKLLVAIFLIIFFVLGIILLVGGNNVALLNPKGYVAIQQKQVMLFSLGIMLAVGVVIVTAGFYIAFKYRDNNSQNQYSPDWDHHAGLEVLRWGLPAAIVFILSIVAWSSTHALDPFKYVPAAAKPMTIQVVALQWKWLFIYPEQKIATVNFVEFPEDTPVDFELTSDAPMNSFWIPQLGGQMYAMAGMVTHLNLKADEKGEYMGSAAEINGPGFSGMRFAAKAVSSSEFESWVGSVKTTSDDLDLAAYERILIPSENNKPAVYGDVEGDLFNDIVSKYMPPQTMTDMNIH